MSESNDTKQHAGESRPQDDEVVEGEVLAEEPAQETATAGDPAAAETDDRQSGPEDGGADEAERLRQQLEAARQESKDNLDQAIRARADMENLRKRTSRDVEQAHKFALEKFVSELLPVIDSLELGLDAAGSAEDADSLREGMQLTLKKFLDALEKFGVSVIDPQGEKFNPEYHEAVSTQELEGYESGLVTSVMQKGYELNGRLVRPAMVIVAK